MEPLIFFAPPEAVSGDVIELPPSEAHHAAGVLRLKSGAIILVADGSGMAYRGELRFESKSHATVAIQKRLLNFGEPQLHLTLVAGLSVGYKSDDVVDQATQLGIRKFVPVITEKSRVKLDDPKRIASRTARLEKVALAAMKQCRRSYRPVIDAPISLNQYLMTDESDSTKLIFHPSPDASPILDWPEDRASKRVIILVGPEAGFSSNELQLAVSKGFSPISLGRRVLRTELAGPVACALVMERFGELR